MTEGIKMGLDMRSLGRMAREMVRQQMCKRMWKTAKKDDKKDGGVYDVENSIKHGVQDEIAKEIRHGRDCDSAYLSMDEDLGEKGVTLDDEVDTSSDDKGRQLLRNRTAERLSVVRSVRVFQTLWNGFQSLGISRRPTAGPKMT